MLFFFVKKKKLIFFKICLELTNEVCQVKQKAIELAKAMENEDGVTGAVKAFFKHLPRKKPESEPSPEPSSLFSIRRCFGCS